MRIVPIILTKCQCSNNAYLIFKHNVKPVVNNDDKAYRFIYALSPGRQIKKSRCINDRIGNTTIFIRGEGGILHLGAYESLVGFAKVLQRSFGHELVRTKMTLKSVTSRHLCVQK